MKLLDRYVLRQLLQQLLLILGALTGLYLLVDVFEKLGVFQERHLPLSLAGRYFALELPMILDQIGPAALLLAGVITLGLMMNRRELQSLNAAGVSKLRILAPFALGAGLCALLGLAVAQWLLPGSGREVNRIWRQEVKGERRAGTVRNGVTFFRGRQGIYSFTTEGTSLNQLQDFRYQELPEGRGEGRLIYAQTASYADGLWQLEHGQIRGAGDNPEVVPFEEKTLTLPEDAAAFFAPVILDFEQSPLSLLSQARDRGNPGRRQAWLDLNRRLSFLLLGPPLLALALPLILCFERGRSGVNLALAVPVCAGLAFLVWGLWSGLAAMAQAGTAPVLAASWSIHLLCLAGGMVVIRCRG